MARLFEKVGDKQLPHQARASRLRETLIIAIRLAEALDRAVQNQIISPSPLSEAEKFHWHGYAKRAGDRLLKCARMLEPKEANE